jgi:3'-phosphoadenosine 5'-phosphosulfate sulfotransferase (PAPS reductase)/FAD synthetase
VADKGSNTLSLFADDRCCASTLDVADATVPSTNQEIPDLASYSRIVQFFSGGKDSIACVLQLLRMGVDPDKIELHHHVIDGREGSTLMDWPVTESYCNAFAQALGLRIFFSWKQGGFEREMLRENALTAPVVFERSDGTLSVTGGERGKLGTRLKFPQVSADLSVRWCSAYCKCDVGSRIITNEDRFTQGKTLVVTGERAEESSARARYATFERNRADRRDGRRVQRHVDHWRPVHGWSEQQVWDILRDYRINPHPAYRLGWGRCSCRTCIFGSANQWATVAAYMPEAFERIALYEERFGVTIQRKLSVRQLAAKGTPYDCDPDVVRLACSTHYDAPIIVDEWKLPAGAFQESAGPT